MADESVSSFLLSVFSDPIALDDRYAVERNGILDVEAVLGVLRNDLDPDGGSLTVISASGLEHGSLSAFVTNGRFIYTPDDDFVGEDSFVYSVRDEDGNVSQGTVTITVYDNPPPIVLDDAYAVKRDTVLDVEAADGLLVNDFDPDGGSLRVNSAFNFENGFVSGLVTNGRFSFTPDEGFVGDASFNYNVSDDEEKTGSGTVTITVYDTRPPIASNDAYFVPAGGTLEVDAAEGLLRNDFDPDGGTLRVNSAFGFENGFVSGLVTNGRFTYVPNPGFVGTDTFSYAISNEDGRTDTGTVTIIVGGSDDPVALNDAYVVERDNVLDIAAEEGLLRNDFDPDGGSLRLESAFNFQNGFVSSLVTNGRFAFTPNEGFVGDASFDYLVSDEDGNETIGTVTITVYDNPPPVAVADYYSVRAGEVLDVSFENGLLVNDLDPDGGALRVNSAFDFENGFVSSLVTNGRFAFTPDDGFVGDARFSYNVEDDEGNFSTATVTITVFDDNRAPIALDDDYAVAAGGVLSVTTEQGVLANDLDPDGDAVLVNGLLDSVDHGSLSLFVSGTFTYTPDPGFAGEDSFTYRIRDAEGVTATATVRLGVYGEIAPVATDDVATTEEEMAVVVDVLDNDVDLNGDTLSIQSFSQAEHGSVAAAAGGLRYTPDDDYVGPDQFSYVVADGNGGTDTATVMVTVTPVDDDPVAVDDEYATPFGTTLTVSAATGVLDNDIDVDGDGLTASIVSGPSNGSLSLNDAGAFTYVPDAGFSGEDTFVYAASDGDGPTDQATVTITVGDDPGETILLLGTAGRDFLFGTGADERIVTIGGRLDLVLTGDGMDIVEVTDIPGERNVVRVFDFDPELDMLGNLSAADVASTLSFANTTYLTLAGPDRDQIILSNVSSSDTIVFENDLLLG